MPARLRLFILPLLSLALLGGLVTQPRAVPTALSAPVANKVLAQALEIELGKAPRPRYLQPLSSGVMYELLAASGELARRADAVKLTAPIVPQSKSTKNTAGCRNVFKSGEGGGGRKNTRVNQDCGFRRQAEEVVAVNPTNHRNLIAGMNDSRIGFNHCAYAWSNNGGKSWGDQIPPFWQFTLLDGHTADACSDPTVTFDADGNAYVGGVLFDIASAASAFAVAKSNAPIGGEFYHSPDSTLTFQTYRSVPLGVVANDNDFNVFHDKEFIVADANSDSPKKNNVYGTWTRFAVTTEGVGGNSPIYFSQSTNGGATWSPGIEISGSNAAVCTDFSGSADPNACDQDQGSHPIVGPDGTIYVVFGNGNTPLLGINQVLFVSCPGAADCSAPASWTAPTKVGDLIGTHPLGPDSVTGCPFGRGCLPPNGYRVPEFTSMSASVDSGGTLYVAWADTRNVGSNCDFDGGTIGSAATATPPCDNDVFYAFSTDGGATWSETINITPASEVGESAQWQPWSAVTADGGKLYVGYYDRSYGDCEFDGCNDITLATIEDPASASPSIDYARVTTESMPNLVPANNPLQAGFLGDYMWVTLDTKNNVYVVWADTRGLDGAVEEDIYIAKNP